MANYIQYIPQVNSTTYPTSISNAFTAMTADVTALEPLAVAISTTANATAITIDASENVGIGVTPEAWFSTQSVMQLGGLSAFMSTTAQAAGSGSNYSVNGYRDETNWKYIVTNDSLANEKIDEKNIPYTDTLVDQHSSLDRK